MISKNRKADTTELRRRCATLLQKLKNEIRRRMTVEKTLKERERHYAELLAHSRQVQEHLRYFSRQILLAQEEERKQISRELHNKVAQILTAINVHLEMLKMEASSNSRGLKRKISRAQRLVQKSVSIVHRFARELRPTLLDDLGIIPALRAYIKDFTERTRIPIDFKCVAAVGQLSSARQTALYRVVQEALANGVQHAKASKVTLSIRKVRNAIFMTINGNGKSFQATEPLLLGKKNGPLGLLGMRERVEMVGGRFNARSERGNGTTIQAEVPLK